MEPKPASWLQSLKATWASAQPGAFGRFGQESCILRYILSGQVMLIILVGFQGRVPKGRSLALPEDWQRNWNQGLSASFSALEVF